jgi:elongation factor G
VVNVQIPLGKQASFSGVIDLLAMKVYKGKDRGVEIDTVPQEYADQAAERREKMMDAAAEGDDELAMKYLDGAELTEEEIEHGLHVGVDTGRVIPVLMGSAQTGIGITTLLDRIVSELPSPLEVPKIMDGKEYRTEPDTPLSCFVFKTTADPYVGKINYIRVFSGTLKADDVLKNINQGTEEKIHHLFYPKGKQQEATSQVVAGDICAVAKLQSLNTGDTLAASKNQEAFPSLELPEPIYRVAIKPVSKADEDKLGPALTKILQEDPVLRHVRDPILKQDILEGMGDIHLECTIEKLKQRFGVNLVTEDARIPYRETICSSAKAQGKYKRQTGGRGQYGDCWLEIEPLSRGEGFVFENKVVGGAIPKNFIPAVEKGVREALEQGILAGNLVQDVKVTVYDGSYHEVDSSEMAFKIAGSMAFKAAAQKACPIILEPILDVQIEVPDEYVGEIMGDLNARRGRVQGMDSIGGGKTVVRAHVPMASMTRYALDLRSMTKGRGRFSQNLAYYDELPTPETQTLIAAHEKTKAAAEAESSH